MNYTDNPAINWLIEELNSIQKEDPSFSLRAFAKKLELSPSFLSQVFQGKRALKKETVEKIFEKLEYPAEKVSEVNQILEDHQDRVDHLNALKNRLANTRVNEEINKKTVGSDEYMDLSDWHHDAVYSVIGNGCFKQSKEMLIEQLDFTEEKITAVLDKLVKYELLTLEEDGTYKKNYDTYQFYGSAYPGQLAEIKKRFAENQKELFERADDILAKDVDRYAKFSTSYVNIPDDEIEAALALVEEFYKKLETMFTPSTTKTTKLYCLNTQLLPLHKAEKTKKE